MRFRIVNEKNNEQKSERDSSKDPSTRQNSGTKHQRQSSFLEMVKNSYDFYMTIGKDQLKNEQLKIAVEKEEKLKKMIKKQAMAEGRQIKKEKQKKRLARLANKVQTDQNVQNNNEGPSRKVSTQPSRRSQRSRNPISYTQPIIPIEDQEIFDVLEMEQINEQNIKQEKQITKQSDQVIFIEKPMEQQIHKFIVSDPQPKAIVVQSNQKPIKVQSYENPFKVQVNPKPLDKYKAPTVKSQQIIQKIEKVKQELIFEQQGTYQLGAGHQAMLRTQKFIDQHLNFRHQIRQSKFVQITALIKYVKSHGFITFDQTKFNLLTRINPYLYTLSQSDSKYLMTFKLNGLQIERRLQSTKRRMSQVALPELLT